MHTVQPFMKLPWLYIERSGLFSKRCNSFTYMGNTSGPVSMYVKCKCGAHVLFVNVSRCICRNSSDVSSVV